MEVPPRNVSPMRGRPGPPGKTRRPGGAGSFRFGAIVFLLIAIAVLYWLRPLLHPFLMRFYVAPVVWLLPLLILAGGLVIAFRRMLARLRRDNTLRQGDSPFWIVTDSGIWRNRAEVVQEAVATMMAVAALAFVVFAASGLLMPSLVGKSIFQNSEYNPLAKLPPGGQVRLIPKEVAERVAGSGFNSPTEYLSNFHLVKQDGKLVWTALRTPEGAYRAITQQTAGVLTLNASADSRDTELIDGEFKSAPGMYVTDNLTWRLRKERFFAELDDPIAFVDGRGRPAIAVPYVKYTGLLVRRPVFGGVFVVTPDGEIADLSPAEARKRADLAATGRIYPERLARREQEAYAFKNGILNKWFSHEDQTQISHTETNPQPYLLDFGKRGLKYVSSAEPYGRAFAVNGIFMTDALTGRIELWRAPRGAELTGNRRVLETVRSLSIPGIVFAEGGNAPAGDRGGFRVVEPRPVMIGGRLTFMTSIVPDNANNVSKTVFIDAETNRVAAIFDNDSDENADTKVAEYLRTGQSEEAEDPAVAGGGTGATGATGDTGAHAPARGRGDDLGERLDEVLRKQRELIEEIEELRKQVR